MTREEAAKMLRRDIECFSHDSCSDCILEKVCDFTEPEDSEYIEVFELAIEALEQKLKTAKWKRVLDGAWFYEQCTACNTVWDVKSKYCPNCGAKMEED